MDIKIGGFHGHLSIEVAQQIHFHFPATSKEKNTFVLHMDTAIVTGQLEGTKVSIEQGNFLQEMTDRYQQDIQLVTSHEGMVGKPDTYTFLANKRTEEVDYWIDESARIAQILEGEKLSEEDGLHLEQVKAWCESSSLFWKIISRIGWEINEG